jgi:hypothetical protein
VPEGAPFTHDSLKLRRRAITIIHFKYPGHSDCFVYASFILYLKKFARLMTIHLMLTASINAVPELKAAASSVWGCGNSILTPR